MGNRGKNPGCFCGRTNYYDWGKRDLRTWQAEIYVFPNSVERHNLNSQYNVVNRSENLTFNTNKKTNNDRQNKN